MLNIVEIAYEVLACHATSITDASVVLRHQLAAGGFSVFAGVGERTREGNDLYKEMTESVSCLACCEPTSFDVLLKS